jgi:HlyD family secretion protein
MTLLYSYYLVTRNGGMASKGWLTWVAISGIVVLSACQNQSNETQGYIEGQYRYISAQTSGTLQSLNVHRGEQVKQGQLLFQLNQAPQSYQLKQAQAQVQQAQAQLGDLLKGARTPEVDALIAKQQAAQAALVFAKKDLSRQQKLRAKGYNSLASLNLSEQNYHSALADFSAAKANIINAHLPARTDQVFAATAAVQAAKDNAKTIQWQLNQKQQKAPFDAVVNDTYFYSSENVPAQDPVVSLIRPQDVYAIFYVSAKVRAALHVGETLTIKANSTKKLVKARVSYMSTQAMYTPPLIYSEKNMQDLVFEVHAALPSNHIIFWPGQPVVVSWPSKV